MGEFIAFILGFALGGITVLGISLAVLSSKLERLR